MQAKFNFPDADYLSDAALRAALSTCRTFPELKALMKSKLLPPPPRPAELRKASGAAGKVRR